MKAISLSILALMLVGCTLIAVSIKSQAILDKGDGTTDNYADKEQRLDNENTSLSVTGR